MESEQDRKVIIGAVILVLLLLLAIGAFFVNAKTKRNLNAEKLKSESLLSERVQVEQELEKVKNDLASLQEVNEASSKEIADMQTSLTQKDRTIASLSRARKTLEENNAELEVIKEEKDGLENEYARLKTEFEEKTAENETMQNNLVAIEEEKESLESQLREMSLYSSDNFLAYGSRGRKREKLSFWSCLTKKLNVQFEVPQDLSEEISFTITTPSGTTITPDNSSLSWDILPDKDSYTASLSSMPGKAEQMRTVSLTYLAEEKLDKGEYKIEIICNDKNIGNCRLRLK